MIRQTEEHPDYAEMSIVELRDKYVGSLTAAKAERYHKELESRGVGFEFLQDMKKERREERPIHDVLVLFADEILSNGYVPLGIQKKIEEVKSRRPAEK